MHIEGLYLISDQRSRDNTRKKHTWVKGIRVTYCKHCKLDYDWYVENEAPKNGTTQRLATERA